MKGYKPPYSITEAMLILVASISEKIGKIDVYHNLDAKPHLRRNNRIKKKTENMLRLMILMQEGWQKMIRNYFLKPTEISF